MKVSQPINTYYVLVVYLAGYTILVFFANVVRRPGLSFAIQLIVSVSSRFSLILDAIAIYLFALDDFLTS